MLSIIRRCVANKIHYSLFPYTRVISPWMLKFLIANCVWAITSQPLVWFGWNLREMFNTMWRCVTNKNHKSPFPYTRVISPWILKFLIINHVRVITFQPLIGFGWNFTEMFNIMRQCVANNNHHAFFLCTRIICPWAKMYIRSLSLWSVQAAFWNFVEMFVIIDVSQRRTMKQTSFLMELSPLNILIFNLWERTLQVLHILDGNIIHWWNTADKVLQKTP